MFRYSLARPKHAGWEVDPTLACLKAIKYCGPMASYRWLLYGCKYLLLVTEALSRKPLDTVVHHQGLKLNRCLPASLGAVNTCKHVTQEEAYHLVEHPLTHQMGRCKSSHLLLHMPFKPIEQGKRRDCDGTSAGSESASIVSSLYSWLSFQ